jgi:methyl-accepting chemotaxis protein
MNDSRVSEHLNEIAETFREIRETAQEVNRLSLERKELALSIQDEMGELVNRHVTLKDNYGTVQDNIDFSLKEIESNLESFQQNVEYFSQVISSVESISGTMNGMKERIDSMVGIVDEIRDDTDEIFTLALTASVVSTRYTHTSAVFDILADRLNEMSSFIGDNLSNILQVVDPIIRGLEAMLQENEDVLGEIKRGFDNFQEFPSILKEQLHSVEELKRRSMDSGEKLENLGERLKDIGEMVAQMVRDADTAIEGSGTVREHALNMEEFSAGVIEKHDAGEMRDSDVSRLREEAQGIGENAQNVNARSKNQLDFSINSAEYTDDIQSHSRELQEIIDSFNSQSSDNNIMADSISQNLSVLTGQIDSIDRRIDDSGKRINSFREEYRHIDEIISFLKEILKSMNVIGMYSRIESARDPEEFKGFMTISENIIKLQEQIQENIPSIDENIQNMDEVIGEIIEGFSSISRDFRTLAGSSREIIGRLNRISTISSESEKITLAMKESTRVIVEGLDTMRSSISRLSEVVKVPIEGSAKNMERSSTIEELTDGLLASLEQTTVE